ncbi:hypothetical protein ABPG72_010131 [Tetrahymena utriculariae]
MLLGQICFDKGNNEEGFQAFEQALKIKNYDVDEYLNQARFYHKRGMIEKLKKIYENILLQINPDLYQVNFNMLKVFIKRGQKEQCNLLIDRLNQIDDQKLDLRNYLYYNISNYLTHNIDFKELYKNNTLEKIVNRELNESNDPNISLLTKQVVDNSISKLEIVSDFKKMFSNNLKIDIQNDHTCYQLANLFKKYTLNEQAIQWFQKGSQNKSQQLKLFNKFRDILLLMQIILLIRKVVFRTFIKLRQITHIISFFCFQVLENQKLLRSYQIV